MTVDRDMFERLSRALIAELDDRKMLDGMPDGVIFHIGQDLALKVLELMRKPTPRMLKAACKAMSPGRRPTENYISDRAKHGVRYRAMIDAALSYSVGTPEAERENAT